MRTIGYAAVLLTLLLLALSAAPASASVHPLACSENSSAPADSPAITQDPPGITPGGPDSGQATTAQPVVAIRTNSTTDDLNAFKPSGC